MFFAAPSVAIRGADKFDQPDAFHSRPPKVRFPNPLLFLVLHLCVRRGAIPRVSQRGLESRAVASRGDDPESTLAWLHGALLADSRVPLASVTGPYDVVHQREN